MQSRQERPAGLGGHTSVYESSQVKTPEGGLTTTYALTFADGRAVSVALTQPAQLCTSIQWLELTALLSGVQEMLLESIASAPSVKRDAN